MAIGSLPIADPDLAPWPGSESQVGAGCLAREEAVPAGGRRRRRLVTLISCDLWIAGVREWWDRRSFTSSVVSNLLVLAVTGVIVDEVVARRRRQERAVSVAVQGLIVYGQTRRAHDAIAASESPERASNTATEELRTLASMVLTAAPNLFDDPVGAFILGRG